MNSNVKALDQQFGGTHYKGMPFQPIKFGMITGWDVCAYHALKYLSRWRHKGGIEDLEKAKHCIEMRWALRDHCPPPLRTDSIVLNRYISENDIPEDEANILASISALVGARSQEFAVQTTNIICAKIDALIASANESNVTSLQPGAN